MAQTRVRTLILAGAVLTSSAALALEDAASSEGASVNPYLLETFRAAKCGLLEANVVGTNGADRLGGTNPFLNIIAGLGGDDTIYGGGGYDIVCAGTGNDGVRGWEGPDILHGQGGNDSLRGGYGVGPFGADALFGERGKDVLRGGEGRDSLVGGRGRDICIGGPGKDGAAASCEMRREIELVCKNGTIYSTHEGACIKRNARP